MILFTYISKKLPYRRLDYLTIDDDDIELFINDYEGYYTAFRLELFKDCGIITLQYLPNGKDHWACKIIS